MNTNTNILRQGVMSFKRAAEHTRLRVQYQQI